MLLMTDYMTTNQNKHAHSEFFEECLSHSPLEPKLFSLLRTSETFISDAYEQSRSFNTSIVTKNYYFQ